jgi:hypothetical protein
LVQNTIVSDTCCLPVGAFNFLIVLQVLALCVFGSMGGTTSSSVPQPSTPIIKKGWLTKKARTLAWH